MRTFIITKDGIARVMRTYALGIDGRVITPSDTIKEAKPAPDAQDEILKWPAEDQAGVTAVREIAEADIPDVPELKEAWRDNGQKVTVDMPLAREIQAKSIAEALEREASRLRVEETRAVLTGRDATDHKAKLAAIKAFNPMEESVKIKNAKTPRDLSLAWPAMLRKR